MFHQPRTVQNAPIYSYIHLYYCHTKEYERAEMTEPTWPMIITFVHLWIDDDARLSEHPPAVECNDSVINLYRFKAQCRVVWVLQLATKLDLWTEFSPARPNSRNGTKDPSLVAVPTRVTGSNKLIIQLKRTKSSSSQFLLLNGILQKHHHHHHPLCSCCW